MTNETTLQVGDIEIRVYRPVGCEDGLVVIVNDASTCLARVTVRRGEAANVLTVPRDTNGNVVPMRERS